MPVVGSREVTGGRVEEDEQRRCWRERLEASAKALEEALFANQEVEARDDDYIIVTKHIGLKFRHAKKLEMKYMIRSSRNGAETWVKKKFKKSPLSEQIPELIYHLVSMGYGQLETVRRQLERNEMVTVSKSRVNRDGSKPTTCLEFAKLTVSLPSHQGTIPSTRAWISVAVEGDTEEDINAEVEENPALRRFLQEIAAVNNDSALHSDAQVRCDVCSILGGYPFFVQYITGQATATDLEESLLLVQSLR